MATPTKRKELIGRKVTISSSEDDSSQERPIAIAKRKKHKVFKAYQSESDDESVILMNKKGKILKYVLADDESNKQPSKQSTAATLTTPKTKYKQWNVWFNNLKQYQLEHGHCIITAHDKLGRWVQTQRHLSHDENYPKKKLNALKQIGFRLRIKYNKKEVSKLVS